ncbi:MAG TPA: RimK/LysX family protein [Candidatus Saccharimonadales bacterium]|nr:RimK/LysX family protein [Candidatus Saccharimonadales bacterium]
MVDKSSMQIIGRAEKVDFPELSLKRVPARVDTGAKTSSIWASHVKEQGGVLEFVLFDKKNKPFTGEIVKTRIYEKRMVASSMGKSEERCFVRLLVKIKGRNIRATFSLANRSQQVYPVLVGRNILRGKFVVDVKKGQPLINNERKRSTELQSRLKQEGAN